MNSYRRTSYERGSTAETVERDFKRLRIKFEWTGSHEFSNRISALTFTSLTRTQGAMNSEEVYLREMTSEGLRPNNRIITAVLEQKIYCR